MIMSKGHHTTLLWNVFISFVSRTTLWKKSIDQLSQVCFSFLKDIKSIFFPLLCTITKYHSQFHPWSIIGSNFVIMNWATMVSSTWLSRYKTGRILSVDWHRSPHWKEDRACTKRKQPLILHIMAQKRAAALYQLTQCRFPHGGFVLQDGKFL